MCEKNIRTAVIGMGNMGSQYAALLAAGAVPGMELAAVTRVRPETLAARGLTLPAGLPVYQTADELFAAADSGALALDAVIIATPHRLHEEQAVAAMQRGLCVLCDKPAGITSAAARRMEQARPAGLVCGYIFQQRTFPSYRAIRQLVHSGQLGGVKRVSWTVTDWYRSNAYYAGSGWRGSWEKDGGGTLLNQCPHNLDMLQWICGMPARTRAFCHNPASTGWRSLWTTASSSASRRGSRSPGWTSPSRCTGTRRAPALKSPPPIGRPIPWRKTPTPTPMCCAILHSASARATRTGCWRPGRRAARA